MKTTGELSVSPNGGQEEKFEKHSGIERRQIYLSLLKSANGKTVLDIDGGNGEGTRILATIAEEVIVLETEPGTARNANQKQGQSNIRFVQGALNQFPLDALSVDLIVSLAPVSKMTEEMQTQFLQEIKRVLRADGKLIIAIPEITSSPGLLRKYFLYTNLTEQGDKKHQIAICSDLPEIMEDKTGSIDHGEEASLKLLTDRIEALQQEVEKLHVWGKGSATDLEKLRQTFQSKDVLINDRNNIISEQDRKINELQSNVEELNVTISEFYSSEGWKMLSVLYRIRNMILPQGSPLHKNAKRIFNWLRGKKYDQFVIRDHTHSYQRLVDLQTPVQITQFDLPLYAEPRVSIIIPAYNGWEMNYRCLQSIREHTTGIPYEVIFADDASTDDTQLAGQFIGNLVHIRNNTNLGFLQNCNHAATFAKGEYIHFLNNDTIVTHGWLSSLVSLLDADKTIGMAGSKLVYPDGRLQEAGGIIWKEGKGWNYGHGKDPDASEYNYVKETDYISGASILIRQNLWKQLGGFDNRYEPAYCEDSDLAFSVRKAGYKVVYQPLSKVIHFEGFSHGTQVGPKRKRSSNIKSYQKTNSLKFVQKWKAELKTQFPTGVNPFWTRDRSRDKPTIVVIDHYVPHFDKDAGSRTTFQYLEIFVELGMNVKFIGDNFYKHEPYTTILEQKGIEVLYGPWYAKNWFSWLTNNEKYIDFIFLNRPHISVKYIDIIKRKMHGKILYYMHDLHFFREMMEYEVTRDAEKLKSSEEWKKKEYSLFTKSQVVLTPSIKEKDLLLPDFPGKDIRVMPAFFYPTIGEPIRNFAERNDLLFVGGFSHRPNLDGILWFVQEVFPLVLKKNPAIRLIIVGSNAPEQITGLSSPNILIKGFVPDAELERIYQEVRLSVIPLTYGAGLKGKTVEALSKALPIVSTSFGVEGMAEIETVVPAQDSPAGFAEAILSLYDDISGLEQVSAKASTYAKKYFTKDSAREFFKELFQRQTN